MVNNLYPTELSPFDEGSSSEENATATEDVPLPFPDQIQPIKITFLFSRENYDKDQDRDIFTDLTRAFYNLSIKKYINIHEEIEPGETNQEITRKMEDADVILVLLSLDFDHDTFCNSLDMRMRMRELAKKGVRIWPLLLKAYHYEKTDCANDYGLFFSIRESKNLSATQEERYVRITRKLSHEVDYMLADRCVTLGDTYMQQLKIPQALEAYDYALSLVNDYPAALFGKGCAFHEQGQCEEAKQHFEKIISLPANDLPYLSSISRELIMLKNEYYLGRALVEQEAFIEAFQIFKHVYQHKNIFNDKTALPIQKYLEEIYACAYCGEGDLLIGFGDSQQITQYYQRAYMSYRHAYDIQTPWNIYVLKMGDALIKLGINYQDKNWYEQVKNQYKDVVACFSDDAFVQNKYGEVLAILQQNEDALQAYDKALNLNHPQKDEIYEKKGNIYLQLLRAEDALDAFDQALHLDNRKASSYHGKGLALVALDRYKEALQAYELAQQYGEVSSDLMIHAINVLIELIEEEYAFDHMTQANVYMQKVSALCEQLLNQPNASLSSRSIVSCTRGRISFASKNMGYAEICYREGIGLASDHIESYLGIARIAIEDNDQSKANTFCELAAKMSISEAAYAERCLVFGKYFEHFAGKMNSEIYYSNLQNACKYYQRAAHLYPRAFKRALAWKNLGEACKKINRQSEALDAFIKALHDDNRLTECHYLQGECYAKLKRYYEAYLSFSKAIEFDATNLHAWILLGDMLFKMGRYLDAIMIFKQVIDKINSHAYDQLEEDILHTEIAYAYAGTGAAFCSLHEVEDAVNAFIEAHKHDPEIFEYAQYHRPLEVIKSTIEVRIGNHPDDAVSYKQKGDILFAFEQYGEALEAYTRALKSDKLPSIHVAEVKQNCEYASRLSVVQQKINLPGTVLPDGQSSNDNDVENGSPQHRGGLFEKLFSR